MIFSERKTIVFEHLNKLLLSHTIRFPLCPGLFAKDYKAFVIKILGISMASNDSYKNKLGVQQPIVIRKKKKKVGE